ncbi:hypothetical protein B0O99DRAFT_507754, partial [Bisporella sp. PMI_857]
LSETISRLSTKDGVKCTILLSASTGSVIQNTGTISLPSRAANGASSSSSASSSIQTSLSTSTSAAPEDSPRDEMMELAKMVYQFVKTAGALVENLDPQDQTKLLRLRTKRFELVIVPDPKYIFVVVHDTPSA